MDSYLPNNQSESIAKLNDHLRKTFDKRVGLLIFTAGVEQIRSTDPEEFAFILQNLREFDDFEAEENDPHCERDFGAFEINGTKFFFKIDYYDRHSDLTYGSQKPWCNKSTQRVLTLMLAEEY
jgi:hypothetical protein